MTGVAKFRTRAGKVHVIHNGDGTHWTPACNLGQQWEGRRVKADTPLTCRSCQPALDQSATTTIVDPSVAEAMIDGAETMSSCPYCDHDGPVGGSDGHRIPTDCVAHLRWLIEQLRDEVAGLREGQL